MDLTVIICTWNRAKSLSVVLASLEVSRVPEELEWEVLVVDNNSNDGTRAVCESFVAKSPRRFRYLFHGTQGKTNALNAGIREARSEYLALTDDDLTVDPRWVAEIHDTFKKYDCAAIGGKIIPVWNCEKPSWIALDGPYRHPAYGGIVHYDKGDLPILLPATAAGANMGLRKSVFDKYGPYRTDLNRINDLLGGEDTEYCRRLMHAGERLMYAPGAVVYHPVEQVRTTRKFFQSFAFHHGRWIVRMGGMPENMKTYFGFPRYLFPITFGFLRKWMLSIGVQRRFFYRLEFFQALGQIVEGKRWLKNCQGSQAAQNLKSVGLGRAYSD